MDRERDSGRRLRLLVGVGASVGGLGAFKELLEALPVDSGMSFLLVQHLDPTHESLLTDLLAPSTQMPVLAADHGTTLQPNTVYVIRPDTALAVRGDTIELSALEVERGVRLSVDHLFRSLARDLGTRAVGIVLSGAGHDGSGGIRELKAAGALTIAQNPESSVERGMPDSAIRSGVDLVLEIADMPRALERFASLPRPMGRGGSAVCSGSGPTIDEENLPDEQSIEQLAELLEKESAFDLRVYNRGTISRRVNRRMILAGAPDVASYIDHLRGNALAQQALVRDLLISVTEFFRDGEAFSTLRAAVLTPLIKTLSPRETIRCWVAGCATGEEAYSLAMEIYEVCAELDRPPRLQMFATDVDQAALDIARRAVYPLSIVKHVSPQRLGRYFESNGDSGYQVISTIRECVSFVAHDLTKDPPFSRMDLVSCRNTLIYFQGATQQQILSKLHFALRPDGCLFLGPSETTTPHKQHFAEVSKKWRIFRKIGASEPSWWPVRPVAHVRSRNVTPAVPQRTAAGAGDSDLTRQLLDAVLPPAVVVSGDDTVRFMHGDLRPYLQFPSGEQQAPPLFVPLLAEDLAARTRGCVYRCRLDGETVSARAPRQADSLTLITVRPVPAMGEGTVVVTFEERPAEPSSPVATANTDVTTVEAELASTRQDLRNALDELDRSYEELNASNEDSAAMNEELQSANEELEATTEELRSLNEEITAVNVQLAEKVEELERAHAQSERALEALKLNEQRLKWAQDAAGLGVHDYDVKNGVIRWDERVRDIWGIGEDEEITYDLFMAGIVPEDRELTQRAIDRALDPRGSGAYEVEYRVRSRRDGQLRSVAVNGQTSFVNGEAVRLIGTVQDVTARKNSQRLQALLAAIVESSSDAIVSKDLNGVVQSWNKGAERVFGYTAEEMIGRPIKTIIPPELMSDEDYILATLRKGQRVEHFETTRVRKDGERIIVSLTVSPIVGEDGRVLGASKVARDITPLRRAQQELRLSEERLRLAAEGAAFGTFDYDVLSGKLHWSEQLKSIFGVPPDQEETRTALEAGIIHPGDMDRVASARQAALDPQGKGTFDEEFRVVHPDGSVHWVMSKAKTSFEDRDGQRRAVRMVGAVIDITQLKLAEQRFLESESRLQRLFDQAPALIAVHEGPDHVYTYSNPAHDRAVGKRSLVGLSLREAFPELEGQGVFERFDHVYRTGEPVITPSFEVVFDRTGTGVVESGAYTQVLQPGYDAEGRVNGVLSFAFEITLEHELRKRAEESEERFRTLADNMAQLAWMADGSGDIFWYNKRWFDYTGTTLEQVRGWGWQRVQHPDHVHRVKEKLRRSFQTGEQWEDTFPLRSKEGHYRWFLARALPIRDASGAIVRWFGTNTDVTDQRQTQERLREADRRKDEFLAMLGHELRNPLAAISSATQLLQIAGADERLQKRARGVLERQTMHMTRLIDGLLEVSRIARGKIHLDQEVIDLAEVLQSVTHDRSEAIRAGGLTLVVDVDDEPIWIIGDRVRMVQVFDNLLSNAIKFTPAPGTITVSLTKEERTVIAQVFDTGVGIRREMLSTIFEPFQQDMQDIARTQGGLGLGLALCRGIIELHNGTIEAHSAGPGSGAEIQVCLPLTDPPAATSTPSVRVASKPRRVLLIEDNQDAAQMLSGLLEAHGHTVLVASGGLQALDLLRAEPIDLVLCDLGLPGMSGYDVARAIRSDEELCGLLLIALTGYGQAEDRQATADAGFDHHLVKPIDIDALEQVLEQASDKADRS